VATAVSLTDEKIQELMAGWQAVSNRQDELNAQITELKGQVETYQVMLMEFTNMTLPEIQALVSATDLEVSDLKDNTVTDLEALVSQHDLSLININTVDIPAMRSYLDLIGSDQLEIGVPYRQDEPPVDDDPDNPILPGTRWYDTNDNNKEHFWNGTDWVDAMTVPDLSLTVQKFKTSTHQLY
jgi:hypothetical protein